METKICTKCKKEYPRTDKYFVKATKNKDGLDYWCKKCKCEHRKIKSNIKSPKALDDTSETKLNMSSEEYRKNYYEKNKEKILKTVKEYQRNNKNKIKARRKIYLEKNREKTNITRREYNKNHKEIKRLWQQKNKDKVNVQKQARRTNKNNLPSNLTIKQWKEIKIKFNNKCAYCGQELPLSQDHFIPLSKGGEYTVNNIIPSCKSCNCSKNNSDFFKWYPKQEFYSKEREKNILKHLNYKEDKQQLKLI
jgi:hypothetical protein